MKFGVELLPMDPLWKTVYYAIHAEKIGLDHIWVTDHFYNRNLWITLSLAANYTSKIKLGPAAANPYLTHPVVTAQAVLTLNEIAPGRVVCGLGRGDRTTLGMLNVDQGRPTSAIREAVRIVRSIAAGESITLKGKKTSRVRLNFKADNPIPVYIGAQGPRMLALAGEIGDGVLIDASQPEDIRASIKYLNKGLKRSSETKAGFDVTAYTVSSIHEDPSEAEKAVRHVVAFLVAGSSPQLLERHGLSAEKASEIRDLITREKWDGVLSSITLDMVEAFSICGTPGTVVEKFAQLSKLGVTQIVIGSPVGPVVKKSMDLVKNEILPHFKA